MRNLILRKITSNANLKHNQVVHSLLILPFSHLVRLANFGKSGIYVCQLVGQVCYIDFRGFYFSLVMMECLIYHFGSFKININYDRLTVEVVKFELEVD